MEIKEYDEIKDETKKKRFFNIKTDILRKS